VVCSAQRPLIERLAAPGIRAWGEAVPWPAAFRDGPAPAVDDVGHQRARAEAAPLRLGGEKRDGLAVHQEPAPGEGTVALGAENVDGARRVLRVTSAEPPPADDTGRSQRGTVQRGPSNLRFCFQCLRHNPFARCGCPHPATVHFRFWGFRPYPTRSASPDDWCPNQAESIWNPWRRGRSS